MTHTDIFPPLRRRTQIVDGLVLSFGTLLYAAFFCFTEPSLFESIDYVLFYFPNFRFLLDSLANGQVPLWNPYIGLGRPFLADSQNAFFYPPLYLICLGLRPGIFLLVWGHSLLAACGFRALAPRLGVGRLQGHLMALSFLASLALTGRWMSGQILYCCACCYLPWLFWGATHLGETWNVRLTIYAGLMALQFLCGHPQIFWISALGQAAFVFVRSCQVPLAQTARRFLRSFAQLGLVALWCAGLVAVLLLPFLELTQEGNRADPTLAFVNYGHLQWAELLSLASVSVLNPVINWESNLFIGPIIVVLGLAGLFYWREPNTRGLLAILFLGLIISLGRATPLFGVLYHGLPGYSSFRFHARAGILIVFALICAAGIWLSRPHPWLRTLLEANWTIPSRYLLALLIAVQAMDCLYNNWRLREPYSFAAIMGRTPDYPFQRIVAGELEKAGLRRPFQVPPRIRIDWSLVPANYAMIYGYANFDAYTSLFLRRPWDYLHRQLGVEPPPLKTTSLSWEVYQKELFPYRDVACWAAADPVTQSFLLATNPAPRAFVVYAARALDSRDSILKALHQGQDIQRCALVETPLANGMPEKSDQPATPVAITRFEANQLLLDVDAKADGLLVLAEAWYPGWQAEIDGKSGPTLPANIWMRALPVTAGQHRVRVYYRQNFLVAGTILSSLSILCLLISLMFGRAVSRILSAWRP